jgi:HlyD family secretion protein
VNKQVVIAIAMVAVLAAGAYGVSLTMPDATVSTAQTSGAKPTPKPKASNEITAEGKVVPASSVALTFSANGRVAKIFVQEGQKITKGTPLAQLDTRALELSVAQARAALHVAQANYEDLRAGASPEEIAAAQAQVAQAKAQQRQVAGSVTSQDIAAAKARVDQAAAALAQLQGGPKDEDLKLAQSQVRQSEVSLQAQRDSLSAAKTNAQLDMDKAVAALTQAQAAYATAKQNWDFVESSGQDPASPTSTDPATGKTRSNKLNETQRQQYYDAYVQSEAALHSAESALQQAKLAFDTARQQEVSGIAAAEAQLRDSQLALSKVQRPADSDQVAAARAELAAARAQLAKLQGDSRAGSVAAAKAGVDAAQSNLERLSSGPRQTALAQAQAQIESADVALKQAELALDQATLTAPLDGVVAELNLKVGEIPSPGVSALVLADLNRWQIETTDLTELSVVPISVGAPAKVTFDAISGFTLDGKVTDVKSIGKNKQGDITYTVVVTPDQFDQRLRWNMTAIVTIIAR